MRKIISISITIFSIIFLILVSMWLIGRNDAKKAGLTPLSFREFLSLSESQTPGKKAGQTGSLSSFFSGGNKNEGTSLNQDSANGVTGTPEDGTRVSQFTNNNILPNSNSEKKDLNNDGVPDTDFNHDGKIDINDDYDEDNVKNSADNCPFDKNTDQIDTDKDGIGDVCDPEKDTANFDIDGDGIKNDIDNCPFEKNVDQKDTDKGGLGDGCGPINIVDSYCIYPYTQETSGVGNVSCKCLAPNTAIKEKVGGIEVNSCIAPNDNIPTNECFAPNEIINGECINPNINDNTASPECSDGIDNDNDGFIDYPKDLQCSSAYDTDEYTDQCSDADSNIEFTDEEIAQLQKLQERFYNVAQYLHDDNDVAIEIANHDSFKIKADKIKGYYDYCQEVAPKITEKGLQNRVPTPFWHNTTTDSTTFIPKLENTPSFFAEIAKTINRDKALSIEKMLRLNLW